MKLTDELQAQMVGALKQSFPRMTAAGWEPELTERECVIAAVAYGAGAEDMRERAAKACDSWAGSNEGYTVPDFMCGTEARSCAAAIRALEVDDD